MGNEDYRGKAVVVTRQLPGQEIVPSIVICISDEDIDSELNLESFIKGRAEEHMAEIKNKFVEFRNATWTSHVVDSVNY